MGQDEVFPEQVVGSGDEVVRIAGNYRAPAAAGDVRKADVIAKPEAAEEEGHPERGGRRQVGGEFLAQLRQIGRVEAKGYGLFLRHEEVGLQGVGDEDQGAAEYPLTDLVQI